MEWYDDKDIKSAIQWLNKRAYVVDGVLVVDWDNVKEAFEDVSQSHQKG